MLRTTVYLDEETVLAIRQLADTERRSQAEIIREALRTYLEQAERHTGRPLPKGIGAYRSGRRDVAERSEELLRSAARQRRA